MAESAPILHSRPQLIRSSKKLLVGPLANIRHALVASLFLLTTAAAVSAQSVTDPTRVEFTPSASPGALDVRTSTPQVEKYTLDIYRAGSSTVVQKVDLGNPS